MQRPPSEPAGRRDRDRAGQPVHVPVLLAETLDALELAPGLTVVDGTIGAGGHGLEIARALGPEGLLLGLDRDGEILARTQKALDAGAEGRARVSLHHLPFSRMREALEQEGISACDRVLLDLGVSSLQLDSAERGFSFMADGPLDMRMDRTAPVTAEGWLAGVPEPELARVLREYGDERHARRIARHLCRLRQQEPLRRTRQLADAVLQALPPPARRQRIHAATRTFQAVRMAVNDEPGELQRGLEAARGCLRLRGRLCVIAFHSAEDRIVKRFLRERMQPAFKKPKTAGAAEVRRNPRARSARLRCGIKAGEETA